MPSRDSARLAIVALGEPMVEFNQARADGATDSELLPAQDLLHSLSGVLGLRLEPKTVDNQGAEPFIEMLIELRRELRAQKMYALADQLRQKLTAAGVILEDSKEGTTWRWG